MDKKTLRCHIQVGGLKANIKLSGWGGGKQECVVIPAIEYGWNGGMKDSPRFKVLLKSKGKGGHIDRQKQTPWSWTRRGNCTKRYGSVEARREQFYLWGLVKVSFHWGDDIWTEFWWICACWSQKEERVAQALIISLPSSQGDKLIHTRESGSSISYSFPVEVLSLYFAILIIICNLS